MSKDEMERSEVLALTTEIVAAYVSNNTLPSEQIPKVIEQVYRSLVSIDADAAVAADRPQPAVPINKSVLPDYIICLEDGKQLKMLKRHLKTAYGMTPEDYRARWGLPHDYPMVAPNYAKQRSQLARDIGLGTQKRVAG